MGTAARENNTGARHGNSDLRTVTRTDLRTVNGKAKPNMATRGKRDEIGDIQSVRCRSGNDLCHSNSRRLGQSDVLRHQMSAQCRPSQLDITSEPSQTIPARLSIASTATQQRFNCHPGRSTTTQDVLRLKTAPGGSGRLRTAHNDAGQLTMTQCGSTATHGDSRRLRPAQPRVPAEWHITARRFYHHRRHRRRRRRRDRPNAAKRRPNRTAPALFALAPSTAAATDQRKSNWGAATNWARPSAWSRPAPVCGQVASHRTAACHSQRANIASGAGKRTSEIRRRRSSAPVYACVSVSGGMHYLIAMTQSAHYTLHRDSD